MTFEKRPRQWETQQAGKIHVVAMQMLDRNDAFLQPTIVNDPGRFVKG